MTPDDPAFITLTKSVNRIEAALLGDAMQGRKGIIHFHDQMAEDLYGVGPDGKPIEGKSNTLLNRMSDMEDKQKKAIWIFGTIIAIITAIKVGWAALVEKIFEK